LKTAIDKVTPMTDGSDAHQLALDIIDVHGREAPTVARENARAAAIAGQAERAKSWIRVLEIIQRQQADSASPAVGPNLRAEIMNNGCSRSN
jgi:hypothetical protein